MSQENFGGLREAALQRDGYQCQACGELDLAQLLVHHRRPGVHELRFLITLCRRCHTRVHHTWRPRFLGFLRRLWREANPDMAEQRLLALLEAREAATQAELFDWGPY